MRVRAVAVAAAFAALCVSGAAMASGYAEVWNPPESTGHVAKQPKKKSGAAKVKPAAGSKAGAKHVAGAKHSAPHVMAASASGHSNKAAQGHVKPVAAKGVTKSGAGTAGARKTPSKAALMVQSDKPHAKQHAASHAQVAQAKTGQGKIVRANLVQGHTARPHVVKVAAKTGAAKPAASHANVPAQSANVSASPSSNVTNNPATASSGSLPPILH
ncbi:hypothetical protein A6V36_10000 [Paraburkholderia ginsengiterrae]|uniref:Uncharacterized protein n=2 Tax=Paraburkholderia ginsengiterrae TaxID=1462993 RepID=A0A1A9NIA9_9BURK|nr:hypothetical protein A6V36_10000 [Paraburkholderia ginsengiterrae]OAJ65905.1 hypothetical protein A6V37_12840 [Paraburkholderia ginsengiterrae]